MTEHIDQSVFLECKAAGIPSPQISWSNDEILLHSNSEHVITSTNDEDGNTISTLTIISTKVTHGGAYSCAAVNNVGTIRHSARLNIYGMKADLTACHICINIYIYIYIPLENEKYVSLCFQDHFILVRCPT